MTDTEVKVKIGTENAEAPIKRSPNSWEVGLQCNMHQAGFGQEQKVFSMYEMPVESSFPHDYATSKSSY